MNEEFDNWNNLKKGIHDKYTRKYYHEREIWWCLLGRNIGYEHNGDKFENQRPVLIVKSLGANTCYITPLTSSKSTHPLRIPIGSIDDKPASIVISQLRVIDTKRLSQKICTLDKERFEVTRKAIKDLL